MAAKKNPKGTFEESLRRLDEIVEALEEGKVSLDEAVGLYEEGVQLSKECAEKLKATELKIKKLSKLAGGEFEVTGADDE